MADEQASEQVNNTILNDLLMERGISKESIPYRTIGRSKQLRGRPSGTFLFP
jgi:hypothetical protein